MGIEIRLPNITATDTEGKMSQMQSYMHQLVEQLNWALSTVDNAIGGNTSNVVMTSQSASKSEDNSVDTFNSIKALIIKSADIVTAYEDVMREGFNGEYFADSDFGQYINDTKLAIETNSKNITDTFTSVEKISNAEGTGSFDEYVKDVDAYIRRGRLGEYQDGPLKGQTAYGVAVGEKTTTNGVETFNGYAWFTAGRLSFFNESGNEVAYISKSKLYITNATFLGNVQMGQYIVDTSDGIAFLWGG